MDRTRIRDPPTDDLMKQLLRRIVRFLLSFISAKERQGQYMKIDSSMIVVFQQTANALAQGTLPEFAPEQRAEVVRAFGFLEMSLDGGNVFFQHRYEGFFTEWLAWMNAGLSKLSNHTVSLSLADRQKAIFLLAKEGETKQLVLRSTAPNPFEFVSCSQDAKKSEGWPAW